MTKQEFDFIESFRVIKHRAHKCSIDHEFWQGGIENSNAGEKIALMHSELSEVLEALRDGQPQSKKIPFFLLIEEELADTIIRIMDFAGAHNLNIEAAIIAKIEYNESREVKHGRKF